MWKNLIAIGIVFLLKEKRLWVRVRIRYQILCMENKLRPEAVEYIPESKFENTPSGTNYFYHQYRILAERRMREKSN